MDILTKKTLALGGPRRFEITARLDADEVDLILWALEAYIAKSYGQPLDGLAKRLHGDLFEAYSHDDKA